MNQDRIVALVDAQSRRREHIESLTLRAVLALVAGMAGFWYTPKRIQAFKADVLEQVGEAQQALGTLTAEYLDAVLEELGATPPRQVFNLDTRVRQVDPLTEWDRPAEQYRYQRSIGADEATAQRAAFNRARQLVGDDITAAQQQATVTRLRDYPEVTGYRRVIHPELSKSGVCGLCVAASTMKYKTDELLPMHGDCKCGVLPITAQWDPAHTANSVDLAALYKRAGSTGAGDLSRVRFKVEDHSELGPRLLAA